MKYATIITQTITATALVLGMAAQATAAESTQAHVGTESIAKIGTREGINPQAVDDQALESQGTHYRTSFEVGSPLLGGTQEGMYRERVKAEGNQTLSQQVAHTDHNDTNAGILAHGTRG